MCIRDSFGGSFSTFNRITLIINKSIEASYSNVSKSFEFTQVAQLANVDSRQDAECNLAVLIIDVSQRASWECNLLAQVRHVNRSSEATVGVTVVDIHDVDTASLGSLFHQGKEQVLSLYCLTGDGFITLIPIVKCVKLWLAESVVQTRNITRAEERNLLVLDEAAIE